MIILLLKPTAFKKSNKTEHTATVSQTNLWLIARRKFLLALINGFRLVTEILMNDKSMVRWLYKQGANSSCLLLKYSNSQKHLHLLMSEI